MLACLVGWAEWSGFLITNDGIEGYEWDSRQQGRPGSGRQKAGEEEDEMRKLDEESITGKGRLWGGGLESAGVGKRSTAVMNMTEKTGTGILDNRTPRLDPRGEERSTEREKGGRGVGRESNESDFFFPAANRPTDRPDRLRTGCCYCCCLRWQPVRIPRPPFSCHLIFFSYYRHRIYPSILPIQYNLRIVSRASLTAFLEL